MTELVEPPVTIRRGKFSDQYAFGRDRYQRSRRLRLMDLNLYRALPGEDSYFNPAEAGEFCVVDVVTAEKAWFELQPGAESLEVKSLIESHFAATAFQVGPGMWFV